MRVVLKSDAGVCRDLLEEPVVLRSVYFLGIIGLFSTAGVPAAVALQYPAI